MRCHVYVLPRSSIMYSSTVLVSSLALFSMASSSPVLPRACVGPNVNAATVALIKEFEGFVASPEPDPIGLPTVGYGHLCQTDGCSEVPYSIPLTESTASQLLASDLKVCITQSERSLHGLDDFYSPPNKPSRSTPHHPLYSMQISMAHWYPGLSMLATET